MYFRKHPICCRCHFFIYFHFITQNIEKLLIVAGFLLVYLEEVESASHGAEEEDLHKVDDLAVLKLGAQ